MEVAIGLYPHVVGDDWVVDSRGQLDLRYLQGMGHRVADGAVDLWGTAQGVGVLDSLGGTFTTGLDEVRTF